jgi:hypothetical protein
MSHDDFEFEPVPGLPGPLPPQEQLLWQGTPDWWALAVGAFHARKVGIYLLLMLGWQSVNALRAPSAGSFKALALSSVLSAFAYAVLLGLAYLSARSTVYSVTTRRVLMRYGVAIPMTLNIPLRTIDSVDLKRQDGERGEIYFRPLSDKRIGYMVTWPHLRPGSWARPVPSFRALAALGGAVAALRQGLASENGAPETVTPSPRVPLPANAVAA